MSEIREEEENEEEYDAIPEAKAMSNGSITKENVSSKHRTAD